ncbi:MAG: murein biosynthesis integral membrane protein MurJ [Candidatus Eisenbacteria bacterium]|nr:murein biosynthesis integral membrane protein MurJ [Candidatus Eisenbacteria bacterium]
MSSSDVSDAVPAAPHPPAGRDSRLARNAGQVSVATFLSRILGLVREQVLAALFGAGLATDAFNVAFRIPNLLRDLFAEGALSASFVPTLTGYVAKGERREAFRLTSLVLNGLGVVLLGICAVMILFADPLVHLFAPGFGAVAGKLELTTSLTRWMIPFLLLIAWAAAVMGVLNAHERFFLPAAAPMALNVGMIAGGVGLVPVARWLGYEPIYGMAWGVLLGGLGQWLVQLPSLHRIGYRHRWEVDFTHPGVRRMMGLMLPATVGLAATQVNLLVNTVIASLLVQGSVSWLSYAFRLMQLPIGIFGVSVATVTLPAVSRAAALGDMDGFARKLTGGLRLAFFLTLPATAWLVTLAPQIIGLLYQRGRFHAHDTAMTSQALWCYGVGLFAYAAVKVLVPAFYALGETRVPVRASFLAVGANIVLNLLLMHPLQHRGLALSTSATMIVNFGALLWAMRRRLPQLRVGELAGHFSRVALASAVFAAGAWGALQGLLRVFPGHAFHEHVVVLALASLAGTTGYVAAAAVLQVEELGTVLGLVRKLVPGAKG